MVKLSRIRVRSIAPDSNQEGPRDTFLIYSKNVARTSRVKPVLNWANVCSPEHTSDTSTNYDSFLN